MKPEKYCATTDCKNLHTIRSQWCQSCRLSLLRWIRMTGAEQEASKYRAYRRYNRVNTFGGRKGKVVQFKRKTA